MTNPISKSPHAARSLLNDPIISRSMNESLARMLRNVKERRFKAGEVIYSANAEATYLYLMHQGTVELITSSGKTVRIDSNRFGEEAATDVPHYLSDAIAVTEVVAFAIPRASLAGLNQYNPGHQAQFYFSLFANIGGERIRNQEAKPSVTGSDSDTLHSFGWLATILVPLIVLALGSNFGLGHETTIFLAIFTATVMMWVFELVDEYIPGLFALLITLALGLAPTKIVLGGFASDGFFMAMSILGLGTVVVASGLSFRFLLWLLRYLPNTPGGHNLGLLLTGMLLTPILPSINARAVLVAPFLIDMIETVKFQFSGKAATRLAVAAFTGATLLSACFMTSRSINLVIFGLLLPQQQEHFQWVYWVFASSVTAVSMLIIYFVAVSLAFPNTEASQLSKDQIVEQLSLLGAIKRREWAAIAGVLIFAIGVATASIHNVAPPWLGMAILFCLLLFGSLRKNEFRENTDWPSLIYLGSLTGLLNVFGYFGLDKWISGNLSGLGDVMRTDFNVFVAILFCTVMVLRFAIPNTATIALCATIFMPLAAHAGVHPWVIGFILLLLGDLWILPYQCPHYQQFADLLRSRGVYNERIFLRFNLFMNLVRLGGIYASIPFWVWLGLL